MSDGVTLFGKYNVKARPKRQQHRCSKCCGAVLVSILLELCSCYVNWYWFDRAILVANVSDNFPKKTHFDIPSKHFASGNKSIDSFEWEGAYIDPNTGCQENGFVRFIAMISKIRNLMRKSSSAKLQNSKLALMQFICQSVQLFSQIFSFISHVSVC